MTNIPYQRNEPTLAARIIPAEHTRAYRLTFRVEGGLHFIRGNKSPYFTLTYTSHRKGFPNQVYSGGAGHEIILKYYPRFADLAALHTSDIDGVPSHGESNGWYIMAGALPGNAGQQYHAGNSERHFPKPVEQMDKAKPWDKTDYRLPKPDECLESFAEHVRVDVETARQVRDKLVEVWTETRDMCEQSSEFGDNALVWTQSSWSTTRMWFQAWIGEQKPRWKQEANACIEKHGLVVFGDQWPPVEAEQTA